MNLKTDYKDEILKIGETYRTYNIVSDTGEILYPNIHLEKAYVPSQEGDNFGAADINTVTKLLNILPMENGGTGATNSEQALANLGVDNYIIEEGSERGWQWQKYKNGQARAYVQQSWLVDHVKWVAWVNQYYSNEAPAIDLPVGVFKEVTAVSNTVYSSSVGDAWGVLTGGGVDINKTIPATVLVRPTPSQVDRYASRYVIVEGRWK